MKKVLSIVLTLALLLTALPLALGMTASAAGTGDYAIYFDNSSNGNNFWVTKRNDDHPEIGMEELNLPAGETYTVEFDVYALTAGSNVVFGATKSTWDTTTAIEKGHQVWKEAPATTNTWTHYSFNVKTTETWKGVIFYVIGDGFKGYIDNLTIKDSTGKVAASFEPTAADLTKTSNCAKNVELSPCLVEAKTPKAKDYAILVDNSAGTGNGQLYLHEVGMPYDNALPAGDYTVSFDFYTLDATSTLLALNISRGDWNGNCMDQIYPDAPSEIGVWKTVSRDVTLTDNAKFPWFWVGAGLKGYMDNFKITSKATGEVGLSFEGVAADLGKTSKGINTVVELPEEIEAAKYPKAKDYAILVDNSAGTGNGQLYLHEVGMPYDNALPAGDYTVSFDFYTLDATSTLLALNISRGDWNGNCMDQIYPDAPSEIGVWKTVSRDVTLTDNAKFPWFWVGAGLKGYMDNFKITSKATGEVGLSFEGVAADLGKTSKGINTVVELPADVEAAKYPPYHKNTKEDVVDATYFTEGSKTVTCTDCGEVVSTEVIPAANDALVNGFATKYENGKFVIEFEYTDALMMDIIDGAVITFNYTVNGYTNAVVLDGDEGATVTLEGFNADRLTADLTYYLSAEYAGVDTAKINNVKETVKAADKANDATLAELLDALKADGANTVVNGKASNTEWLVSNTIKLDIKAATAELNIAASQKLVDALTTLGKEGRTVTLTVKVGDNFTKDVVITDLRKYTIVKIAGLSFEQLNGDISVKLAFDYEADANDFATEEISFACGDYIYNAGTPVADAFANYLSA